MVKPRWLLSLFLLTLQLAEPGVNSAKFTLVNQCNYTVWPAAVSSGNVNLSTTGFVLKTGESSTVATPATWTGRFWGRTLCANDSSTGNFSCATGDCGSGKVECGGMGGAPPATLVEISTGSVGGRDFYDVSLVDGFNVPVMVVPVGVPGGNCGSAGCPEDLNAVCPAELKVTEKGRVVACQGACGVFFKEFFCCTGEHSSRNTCEPSVYSQSLTVQPQIITSSFVLPPTMPVEVLVTHSLPAMRHLGGFLRQGILRLGSTDFQVSFFNWLYGMTRYQIRPSYGMQMGTNLLLKDQD
ncbi:thaumatin-like protein 1 [Abrus precatorius]|uniref:Thaumatin-like protein 1 n=1 Tax=Abrus precatorius TaxID=3816 RepID=A0A8B8KJE1_ABRPR|nr:thaumatin-like protein 1 [Abrus precatorius]